MNGGELHPALRQSLFIAGTDTGVGKTWVATRLLAALVEGGHRVAGMKPVAAGAELTAQGLRNADALDLAAAGNVRLPYALTNPVCLAQATAPHLAAARAGLQIEIGPIMAAYHAIRSQSGLIIVEGAGGWLVPIGPPAGPEATAPTMQDIARALGLPVVLVVGLRLGCLSHALLTAQAIQRSGLPFAGWVANPIDPGFDDGEAYVESLTARLPAPLLWTAPQVILPSQ
jgi:dethiobiotin synthetase